MPMMAIGSNRRDFVAPLPLPRLILVFSFSLLFLGVLSSFARGSPGFTDKERLFTCCGDRRSFRLLGLLFYCSRSEKDKDALLVLIDDEGSSVILIRNKNVGIQK